ncbi:MAG: hypothetical protein EPO21_02325 [Chloroflexota bacterium]|nr:MAG: hypothetical protein EPO21_02325 [Chloroflexota bacterium]
MTHQTISNHGLVRAAEEDRGLRVWEIEAASRAITDCHFAVQLLGRPELLLDREPVQGVRRKARALLYYVAVHPALIPRERLLPLLWPNVDRPAAQHTLRATLYELHKTLGDALIIDKDMLSLSPATEVDARRFDNCLSDPATDPELLNAALTLYRGDFLDGFSLPDAPEFDGWVAAERERYRHLAIRGLARLADHHERRGRFDDALDALNRALEFDPLQEDVQRTCLRLHYLAGDQSGAIRRYEQLRKLLDEEMGVPPMAETQALYEAIITDTLPRAGEKQTMSHRPSRLTLSASSSRGPTSASLPFVGRDAELKALHAMFSECAGQLVLIEGRPVVGKTRLAEEFIRESGALAISGVAHELEQNLPYQPIIEALRGLTSRPDWRALESTLRRSLAPVWWDEIGRLLPELVASSVSHQQATSMPDDRRLWEAVNQFLRTLSRKQPVIVFLDDLHWANASTLGMLGYLFRQTAGEDITFVAATRYFSSRSPVAALLQVLTRQELLVRVSLTFLQPDDVASVARHLSPDNAHVLTDWLMRNSEGSPYVLTELVRHARESGILRADGEVNLSALSGSRVVPRAVQNRILARLERLSEPARRVLEAVAVRGRNFEFDVVAQASALPENAALDGIDELQAVGLIYPLDGPLWTLVLGLVEDVVHSQIAPARRQLLHRRVAEALENVYRTRLGSIANQLAWHFEQGNAPERAAPYA